MFLLLFHNFHSTKKLTYENIQVLLYNLMLEHREYSSHSVVQNQRIRT
jgi:hypothetical protein